MLSHYSYALFAARILLPLVFIVAAITNMFRWQNTLQFMKSKKSRLPDFSRRSNRIKNSGKCSCHV
ncbi:MAG: hypothetical protein HWD59_14350 [Coxiellaceae bacterium]|nr:MAG: hypothetical protein HWD59_14350 [Coxiellaceae bacterium]